MNHTMFYTIICMNYAILCTILHFHAKPNS
jgi:hypothetical protein